jgi:hypothetical protein
VDEVFEMASELNTSIWGIDSQINQKKMEIIELDKKIAKKHEELNKLIERYGLTADELEDYRLSKSSRGK